MTGDALPDLNDSVSTNLKVHDEFTKYSCSFVFEAEPDMDILEVIDEVQKILNDNFSCSDVIVGTEMLHKSK